MGCMPLFPTRPSSFGAQELRAAWWPDAYERGYDFDALMRTRLLRYLQPGDGETFDVFGDGRWSASTPKVTPRGTSRWWWTCRLRGRIVLAGDAAQVAENLTDKVPAGLCWNSQLAVESIQKLQHLQTQGALVILGHELSALESLKLAPEHYE